MAKKLNFNITRSRITMDKDGDSHHNHYIDDDLQGNLLHQIVSRLPEKSLHRIKCATRPRRMLATNSASEKELLTNSSGFFYQSRETTQVYVHIRKNVATNSRATDQPTYNFMARRSSSTLQRCRVWTPHISLDFLPCYPNFNIRDSCNGLLLCFSNQESKIYVCNPLMRRWVSFPDAIGCNGGELLAFDHKLSPYHHFKVFGHFRLPKSPSKPAEVEFFSSKTRRWDKVELAIKGSTLPNWNARLRARYAGYLNGTVYATVSPQYLIATPAVLEDEDPKQYQWIQLPELCDPYKSTTLTNVCNGRLCCITNDKAQIRVWMMKNGDDHKWVLKRSVSVATLADLVSLPSCYKYYREKASVVVFVPLALDARRSVVYLKTHCMVFEYDWESNKVEEVSELSRCGHHQSDQEFTSYNLSIVAYRPCGNLLEIGSQK